MKEIRRLIPALSMLLCIIVMFLTGCSGSNNAGTTVLNNKKTDISNMQKVEYTSGKDCALATESYVKVSENKSFSLSVNEKDGAIALKNLNNGYTWYSSYDLPANSVAKKLNETWRFNLNSIVSISYYDSENNLGVDSETNAFAKETLIKVKATEGGVDIDYYYKEIGIGLTVQITLKDDGFEIGVPVSSIYEDDKFRLTKVSLAPFFGGAPSNSDGYLFYPDGSGALAYFDPKDALKPAQKVTIQTYGTENLNVPELLSERILKRKSAMLPVFGLKNGENAFFGVITEGAADSYIDISTSNIIVDINNIYATFSYRNRIDITSVNNSISSAKDVKSYKYDSNVSGGDIKVRYYILNGDSADYSGMAATYRKYLKENKLIKEKDCSVLPLSLSVFMGAYEDRAMFSKYMTTTTYEQAAKIVDEMIGAGNESIILTLNGWNKGGYRASVMPAQFNKKYGSKDELKQISAKSGDKLQVFLKQNYTYFDSDVSTFSKGKDIVYQGTGLEAQEDNIYLPNLEGLFNRYLNSFIDFASEFSYGLCVEGTGSQLYSDYNSKYALTRRESEKYITEQLSLNQKNTVGLMTEGNAYMLKYIDGIINLPDGDSGYSVTDEGIPFYQMVVHGSIPYSGETFGNLSANLQSLKLKWIEYGFSPAFEVTYSSSSDLKYTDYNKLYSSKFSNWKKEITDISKELSSLGVSGAEITRHEKISENVYKVEYSNGTVIVVNYGTADITVDGLNVKAEDYTITKGR